MDMGKLTLYRGDYEKIKSFQFVKTHKWCLVGQGIYLTSSMKVADTYRDKGAYSLKAPSPVLFEGEALNRPDAFEKAFPQFLEDYIKVGAEGWVSERDLKVLRKTNEGAARSKYRRLIEDGLIKAEYTATPNQMWRKTSLKVTRKIERNVGYITKFSFDKLTFEQSVVAVNQRISDPMFWEIMFDRGIAFGTHKETRSDYIAWNLQVRGRELPALTLAKDERFWRRLRNALTPFGYRGLEYGGGRYAGGAGNHRAFCVWDEDFVNEHKIERIR